MKYFFESGSENANIREVIGDFDEDINKFAEAFKKAEKKIEDKYEKQKADLGIKCRKEIESLKKDWKKKLTVTIGTPKDETPAK